MNQRATNNSLFTRQRFGVDNSVWLTMLTVLIISGGLLGYTVNKKDPDKPCESITIYINQRSETDNFSYHVNDPIRFRVPITAGDDLSWKFSDGKEYEKEFSIVHRFQKEGLHTVRAVVNGKCIYEKRIRITKPEEYKLDSIGNIKEDIIGPVDAVVGQKVQFTTSLTAEEYEWYIDFKPSYLRQSGNKSEYIFKREGSYTVVLVLDRSREKRFSKEITVVKKPGTGQELPPEIPPLIFPRHKDTPSHPPPVDTSSRVKTVQPEVKKYKELTKEIAKEYIQSLVCEDMKLAEFLQYLCEGENTSVIVNKAERMNFGKFYKQVAGKKIEILSVSIQLDKDKCINNISVSYDKKWGLARNPCK